MNAATLQSQQDAARAYNELFVPALFQQWTPKVAAAAQLLPGQSVLDVGCGTGVLAGEAERRVGSSGQVVGVDPNPGMLAVAAELAPSVEWTRACAESLPFADDSFENVVSQFALMFCTDRELAVREMLRVLQDNGNLAMMVWNCVETMPAYEAEIDVLEQFAGLQAAAAVSAPFALGDEHLLGRLFSEAGASDVRVTTLDGMAQFPSVRTMVEADLRGWLPAMGVELQEDQISHVLEKADDALGSFAGPDGAARFPLSALLVTAKGPKAGN